MAIWDDHLNAFRLFQQFIQSGGRPQEGQRFGAYKYTGGQLVRAGTTTEQDELNRIAGNANLYGGLNDIMKLLQPLFAQQSANFQQAQGRALSEAARMAGAQAAARGISPAALTSRYQANVFNALAPQLGALQEGQLAALLGSTERANQFRTSTALNAWQLQEMMRQFNEQNSFKFFRDLFPGMLSGGFSLATARILKG